MIRAPSFDLGPRRRFGVRSRSLYPAVAQEVTNLEVLRILLSIGGSEIGHFQTWQDKAGNAANITGGDLTFPNFNSGVDPNTGSTGADIADEFQTNLIMPEPTLFLSEKLGPVSIIRPTSTKQGESRGLGSELR